VKGIWLAVLTIRESILKGTLVFYFIFGNLVILFFAIAIGSHEVDGTTVLTFFGEDFAAKGIGTMGPVDFILYQVFQASTQSVILLGIFATAGLIPSMLEKGTVELYLSKPISRTQLFLSRSLGACAGIAANLLYFAIGIWLVFGLKVAVWHWGFLLAILMAVLVFIFYFSIVAFTALVARGSGFAIMLAFIYSFFAGALEMREVGLYRLWDNVVYHRVLDALYYCTPQLTGMMNSANRLIAELPMSPLLHTPNEFTIMPFVYSFLSASAFYAAGAYYFSRQDY